MPKQEFIETVHSFWADAISRSFIGNPPQSAVWYGSEAILAALQPFMAEGRNHGFLPTGGGMDMLGIDVAAEPGCLAIEVDEKIVYVIKPKSLVLEYFPESPVNSFAFLQLDQLKPTGISENAETGERSYSEYIVELEPGRYVERSVWDQGYYDYDDDGREIELPDSARLVTRWLGGKILLVAKTSVWNRTKSTYDGRHNRMQAHKIREVISNALC